MAQTNAGTRQRLVFDLTTCDPHDDYMAKTISIVDDIDGSAGASTVSFAVDGKRYEIDLSKKNRSALGKALKPYVDAGRPASTSGGGRRSGATRSRKPSAVDLGAIREWANVNGHQVSDRGRIAASVVEAYNAAH